MTPTRTIPIGTFGPGGYSPGWDGTFWTARQGATNQGVIGHYDDEGNNLGDGFTFAYGGFYPLDVGYYGGRVFVTHAASFGSRMFGINIGGAHDIVKADAETTDRMGSNQMPLRTYSGGAATLGFGQDNTIATLNLAGGSTEHPWYPQVFMGSGINTPHNPAGNSFETCTVGAGAVGGGEGEPTKCGTQSSYWIAGTHESGFNYPIDVAFGPGGLYVAEYFGDRVSHVNTVSQPGGNLDYRFGIGPGTGAGQLDEPASVIVQASTNNVFVSEQGNRRISVFNSAGGFIAAFGHGVLDGTDTMQVCGIDIGPCLKGTSSASSYFTQLDFGPDGELLAYMPLRGAIQVFSVAGGSATPTGSPPPAPAPAPPIKQTIRLAAAPLKVKKGKKTKLTATINRGADCAKRIVLFQEKDGRSWDNLGKAVKPAKRCRATKKTKVTAKSVFKAILIDSSNQATLASSPSVTVKLK